MATNMAIKILNRYIYIYIYKTIPKVKVGMT